MWGFSGIPGKEAFSFIREALLLKLHTTPAAHPLVSERAWCIWQPFCDCEDSQLRTELTYTVGRIWKSGRETQTWEITF